MLISCLILRSFNDTFQSGLYLFLMGVFLPGGCRELDDVDRLLIACPALAGVWGRERFGLASVAVLQALEVRVPAHVPQMPEPHLRSTLLGFLLAGAPLQCIIRGPYARETCSVAKLGRPTHTGSRAGSAAARSDPSGPLSLGGNH